MEQQTFFTRQDMLRLIHELKEYTRESKEVLGYDERTPEELLEVFLLETPPTTGIQSDDFWNDVVSAIAAAEIMQVSPTDIAGINKWKDKAIETLKSKYLIIKK